MDDNTVSADLHMHTPASDGTIGVEKRAELAAERGLGAIAITDHDTITDSLTARSERIKGVEVITGVEVRADLFDTKAEILGYYVDPTNDRLQSVLERARRFRDQRNQAMVERLSAETGLDLSYERLESSVDGNLGRPHLAQRLVEGGVVDSIDEAFDEYLAEGESAFVPMKRLDHARVIETIHVAGGVTSLAHPGRIRADSDTVREMLRSLVDAGLDGIEVWYPYGVERSEDYAEITVEDTSALASEFGLLKTGGSDCHGPDTGKFRLGETGIPSVSFESLVERTDRYANPPK